MALEEVIITAPYPAFPPVPIYLGQPSTGPFASWYSNNVIPVSSNPASGLTFFTPQPAPKLTGTPSGSSYIDYLKPATSYLDAIAAGGNSASTWFDKTPTPTATTTAGAVALALAEKPFEPLPVSEATARGLVAANEGISEALSAGINQSASKSPTIGKVVTQFDSLMNETPIAKALAKVTAPVVRSIASILAKFALPFDLLWPSSIAPDPNMIRYKKPEVPYQLEEVVITAPYLQPTIPKAYKPPEIVKPYGLTPEIPPTPKAKPVDFPDVIPFSPTIFNPMTDFQPELNPKLDPASRAAPEAPPKFPPRFPPEFPPNFFIPPIPPKKIKPWTPSLPNVGTLPDVSGLIEPAQDLQPQPDYDLAGNKCPPCKKAKEEKEKARQTCYVKLVREHTTPSKDTSYNWRKIPCQ